MGTGPRPVTCERCDAITPSSVRGACTRAGTSADKLQCSRTVAYASNRALNDARITSTTSTTLRAAGPDADAGLPAPASSTTFPWCFEPRSPRPSVSHRTTPCDAARSTGLRVHTRQLQLWPSPGWTVAQEQPAELSVPPFHRKSGISPREHDGVRAGPWNCRPPGGVPTHAVKTCHRTT